MPNPLPVMQERAQAASRQRILSVCFRAFRLSDSTSLAPKRRSTSPGVLASVPLPIQRQLPVSTTMLVRP